MGVCQMTCCKNAPHAVMPLLRSCQTNCETGGSEEVCANFCNIDQTTEHIPIVGVRALSSGSCPTNDPVGTIFEDTLHQLGPLECELMLFCATSNVSAVRWLLYLGAQRDCCDANGSTCLHVACRAGSVQVVTELLMHTPLLWASDIAGWTPLHVAAFIGRREGAVRLLGARADAGAVNLSGQTPMEVCSDLGTLSVFKDDFLEAQYDELMSRRNVVEDSVGTPLECEHIPFFLPPVPAMNLQDRHEELWKLTVLIFNKQPSYGLAFAVATGLANTYSDALLRVLQSSGVNRAQVGGFLGEGLSVSFLTRLRLFDSISLWNTGVVSALQSAFSVFQLPADFQKIHRLLGGLAHVWWRKHKVTSEYLGIETASRTEETSGSELKACLGSLDALTQLFFSTVLLHWYLHGDGQTLKRNFDVSAWMQLNRGLGSDGGDIPAATQWQIHNLVSSGFKKELSLASASMESSEGNTSARLRSEGTGYEASGSIAAWLRSEVEQRDTTSHLNGGGPDEGAGLAVTKPRVSPESCKPEGTRRVLQSVLSPGASREGLPAMRPSCSQSVLSPCASLEGWARHCPIRVKDVAGKLPSSMSEIPFSLMAVTPSQQFSPSSREQGMAALDSTMSEANRAESLFLCPQGDGRIWLSLCGSLLFMLTLASSDSSGASPSEAPHMLMDLTKLRVHHSQDYVAPGSPSAGSPAAASKTGRPRVVTLSGTLEGRKTAKLGPPVAPGKTMKPKSQENHGVSGKQKNIAEQVENQSDVPLSVLHLLPDGRWQELHLHSMELHFASVGEAERWAACLSVPLRRAIDAKAVDVRIQELALDDIADAMPFVLDGLHVDTKLPELNGKDAPDAVEAHPWQESTNRMRSMTL